MEHKGMLRVLAEKLQTARIQHKGYVPVSDDGGLGYELLLTGYDPDSNKSFIVAHPALRVQMPKVMHTVLEEVDFVPIENLPPASEGVKVPGVEGTITEIAHGDFHEVDFFTGFKMSRTHVLPEGGGALGYTLYNHGGVSFYLSPADPDSINENLLWAKDGLRTLEGGARLYVDGKKIEVSTGTTIKRIDGFPMEIFSLDSNDEVEHMGSIEPQGK